MFEMLRVNGAEAPAYVQWISVAPHVYISGTVWKENTGEGLAFGVFVGEGDTVGEVEVDMMGEAEGGARGNRCKTKSKKNDVNEHTR
jgi:hypothetical protein